MTGDVQATGTRRGPRLADRPIRFKAALLLTTPIVAVLVLAGVIGHGALSAASQAEQARRLVALSAVSGELAAELQHERSAAALVFTRHSAATAVDAYVRQAARTDSVDTRYVGAFGGVQVPAGLLPLVQRLRSQLDALPLLREQVRSGSDAAASVTVFRYRAVIADLQSYRSAMSQLGVDAGTADGLRAAATLSQAIESLGLLQVSVLPALQAGEFTPAAQQQVVAADAEFSQAINDFRQLAPAPWPTQLSAQTGGRTAVDGERLQALAVSSLPGEPLDLDTTTDRFATAVGARMDQLHTVEHALDDDLLAQVTAQRDRQWQRIAWLGGAVVAVLLVVMVTAIVMTRSLARPLRRLKVGATELAATTLPDLVEKLTSWQGRAEDLDGVIAGHRPLLAVHGRDEVGALAEAFNLVAGSAIRLASEQALLRRVVTQVVENLARRLQLVVSQVTVHLDRLEADEQDPERMRALFELDETANGTNRLVLSMLALIGQRGGRPVNEPLLIGKVIKVAIGWVEGAAPRVRDEQVDADCLIVAEAVTDLAHLIAEVLSNALSFTPPEGRSVEVSAKLVGDRLHLQVMDFGIGINPDRLPAVQQLIDSYDMTSAVRHMGLSVVGELARRQGLTVTLRSHEDGMPGVCVDVVVPGHLLCKAEPPTMPPAPPAAPAERPAAAPATVPARELVAAGVVIGGPTLLLPAIGEPIGGRPPAGITSPELPLRIYAEVRRSLFDPATAGDPPGPSGAWRASADRAAAVEQYTAATTRAQTTGQPSAAAAATTRSGLPRRVPNQLVIAALPDTPDIPRQHNPAAVAQGLSALSTAIQRPRA
jgi:signal transduction histidine kinase